MTSTGPGYEWDEDEDTDDTQSDDSGDGSDDSQSEDSDDQSDSDGSDNSEDDSTENSDDGQDDTADSSSDDESDPAQTVADASPHAVDAHRNMIGDTLQRLSDQGIDVASLAERAGVDSADVDELTHGDLAGITQYLAQHHPEALQAVSDRYPAAQGLLGALTGGGSGGGFLGRLFGR